MAENDDVTKTSPLRPRALMSNASQRLHGDRQVSSAVVNVRTRRPMVLRNHGVHGCIGLGDPVGRRGRNADRKSDGRHPFHM